MVSVLRRYTPPTCTLEIVAKESPLSRWTNRSAVNQLRFQLSFDDPRLPPERQVQVFGDRIHLDALHDSVETYVRQLLDTAPARLDELWSRLTPGSLTDQTPAPPQASTHRYPAGIAGQASSIQPLESQNGHYVRDEAVTRCGVCLKRNGLLLHQLHLGELANEEAGTVISLSTLQLFDLANALDEYATDILSLPSLNRPARLQRSRWLQIAAVAMLAVGVTTAISKFVIDVTTSPQVATNQPTASAPGATKIPTPAIPPPPADITTLPPLVQGSPLPPPPLPGTTPPAPAGGAAPPTGSAVGNAAPGTTVPPSPVVIPSLPNLAPIPAPSTAIAPNPQPAAIQIPTSPEMAPLPPAVDSASRSAASDSSGATGDGQMRAVEPETLNRQSTTAFDTIPQVAEVRQYFQQRWQPPDNLTQTLEYQLLVGADGTVQRITPLGQAAGAYVDRTGIPLVGEPFVSPIESGRSANIRLVLSPTGEVRTFMEGMR